ncbi:hypothetical protein B0H10DRAFT_1953186 [Mycena sp. CBHHK59/15]|nr:hypothetical protein B0H10DRAFT_1953186 [Mycena sp. CBHHK59/15]
MAPHAGLRSTKAPEPAPNSLVDDVDERDKSLCVGPSEAPPRAPPIKKEEKGKFREVPYWPNDYISPDEEQQINNEYYDKYMQEAEKLLRDTKPDLCLQPSPGSPIILDLSSPIKPAIAEHTLGRTRSMRIANKEKEEKTKVEEAKAAVAQQAQEATIGRVPVVCRKCQPTTPTAVATGKPAPKRQRKAATSPFEAPVVSIAEAAAAVQQPAAQKSRQHCPSRRTSTNPAHRQPVSGEQMARLVALTLAVANMERLTRNNGEKATPPAAQLFRGSAYPPTCNLLFGPPGPKQTLTPNYYQRTHVRTFYGQRADYTMEASAPLLPLDTYAQLMRGFPDKVFLSSQNAWGRESPKQVHYLSAQKHSAAAHPEDPCSRLAQGHSPFQDHPGKRLVINAAREVESKDADLDLAANNNLTPTEFIMAGDILADAVEHHFEPRSHAAMIASQLTPGARPGAVKTEQPEGLAAGCTPGSPKYTIPRQAGIQGECPRETLVPACPGPLTAGLMLYSTEVIKAFIETVDFDMSDWRQEIYEFVSAKDRDELLSTTVAHSNNRLFPPNSPKGKQGWFRPSSPNAIPGPSNQNQWQQKGKGPKEKCMYCGDGSYTGWECQSELGKWCVHRGRSNKLIPPIPQFHICWKFMRWAAQRATHASSHTLALSAEQAWTDPRLQRTLRAQRCEYFLIVTPLKADWWEHWIAEMGLMTEYTDGIIPIHTRPLGVGETTQM